MDIRKATIDDAERLALLGSETFWDAYRSRSKLDTTNIRAYMSTAFTVSQLTAELKDSNTSFLLAEHQRKQAGYSKLIVNSSQESVVFSKPLEISRIYLAKSFWSKGLGKELLNACFDFATSNGCDGVWLAVWRHNQRAIDFYLRNGFEIVGETQFNLSSSIETDHVMAANLPK
jgi:ribosomal protein S18 acetylase RimI-like enzyme